MNIKKIGILISVIALILIIVSEYWANNNRIPKITRITTQRSRTPNPNAYDYYLKATQMLQDKKDIDNSQEIISQNRKNPSNGISSKDVSSMQELIDSNKKVLIELHKGFPYQYQGPKYTSINQLFPYYAGFRRISKLLSINLAMVLGAIILPGGELYLRYTDNMTFNNLFEASLALSLTNFRKRNIRTILTSFPLSTKSP